MDEINIIYKLQKRLQATLQQLGDVMISGGVDNMEKYKYLLGQAQAYQLILQEISNLLNKKEHNDEQTDLTNVVHFGDVNTED
jgi:acetyl-CoA acetyltransferase